MANAEQQQRNGSAPAAPEADRIIRGHTVRPYVERSFLTNLLISVGAQKDDGPVTNELKTSKYTVATFLPINLFEQFTRIANLYFLFIAILQLIPGLSPTSWFTTVCPLVFVLAINAIKEGYDDFNKHKSDDEVNSRKVKVITEDHGETLISWRDVMEGDILKVKQDEEIPADMVFLKSSDPENLCYLETANLDGETNLKIKFSYYKNEGDFKDLPAIQSFCKDNYVSCEQPNARLYVFNGSIKKPTGADSLNADNLLLRGCSLRKTDWVIGIVISTGKNTKIVQNLTKSPRKVTLLEKHMNVLVAGMFGVLAFICVLMGIGHQVWEKAHPDSKEWYLVRKPNVWTEANPGFLAWLVQTIRYIILLNNLIPISLYVTLELVKVLQCTLLMNKDLKMYHKESDTPFVCRTTTLNEELGQVKYVLSDKTGTLTQNVMGFVWASIGGKLYGKGGGRDSMAPGNIPQNTPHSLALDSEIHQHLGTYSQRYPDPEVERFMINLAVCNTVVPTVGDDGKFTYQASSPDEEALVQGAAYLGYKLVSRSSDLVEIEHHNKLWSYQVLATLEFNSDRKRMSIICRCPDGSIKLFCKGADTMILARLAQTELVQETAVIVGQHLEEMSKAGYRTLCIAEKELTQQDYDDFNNELNLAETENASEREKRVAEASETIERDLELVGATAVEDKLQDGVPEAIAQMVASGIKVWVLTGDKVETAISISYSCRLFTLDMQIIELRESHFIEAGGGADGEVALLKSKIQEVAAVNKAMGFAGKSTNVGICIEGGALAYCLKEHCQEDFLKLCNGCKSVVCCRVSPMQKAQVTRLVKYKAGAVTLGIGDGANDVGMIQAAHIGCGISGREGRAAVLASDFSFAQFKYVARLLLLHGRWAYKRNVEVVLYAFYKNWAYTLLGLYLGFVTGYSAQPLFGSSLISTFNLFWAALPTIAFALLEQDLHPDTIMQYPALYMETMLQDRASFFKQMARWMLEGTWHSLVTYFLPMYVLAGPDRDGNSYDLMACGTAIYVALIVTINLKIATRTRHWTWINHACVWLISLGLFLPFIYAVSILWPVYHVAEMADMSDVARRLFASPGFWLSAVLGAPALSLLLDLSILIFQRQFYPQPFQILQEYEVRKSYVQEHQRDMEGQIRGMLGHTGDRNAVVASKAEGPSA